MQVKFKHRDGHLGHDYDAHDGLLIHNYFFGKKQLFCIRLDLAGKNLFFRRWTERKPQTLHRLA